MSEADTNEADGRLQNHKQKVVLSIGTSRPGSCGVKDYGVLLDREIEAGGHKVERVWLERSTSEGWLRGLVSDLSLIKASVSVLRKRPEVAILHYSPFSLGAHGVPLLAQLLPLVSRLMGVRLTTILHELCYPWGVNGIRGMIWATTQRLSLVPVVAGSSALVVSTEERSDWLSRRYGVSRRRLATIPVWSTIRVDTPARRPSGPEMKNKRILGTFGWGKPNAEVDLVLRAVSILQARGHVVCLLLIGSPGADSHEGRRWLAAAKRHNVSDRLMLTGGGITEKQVSAYLSSLEIFIHPDSSGPTPRRTSLAAALAHGRPVVAFSGVQNWSALKPGIEIVLAEPNAESLALKLEELLSSESLRQKLSDGAIKAHEREMSLPSAVRSIMSLSFQGDALSRDVRNRDF